MSLLSLNVWCQQREEQRSTAALETWSRGLARAAARLDASVWLEEVGARALASHEHARFDHATLEA